MNLITHLLGPAALGQCSETDDKSNDSLEDDELDSSQDGDSDSTEEDEFYDAEPDVKDDRGTSS